MQYEYFYGAQAEQFSFYRIPKALFTEPNFRELSTDAKVLYGILLDRMSLSLKNQWLDTHTDFLCDLDGASEQPYAAGYIQPCFVKPKGFNLICIIIKNFSHIAAVLLVFSKAGGYNN